MKFIESKTPFLCVHNEICGKCLKKVERTYLMVLDYIDNDNCANNKEYAVDTYCFECIKEELEMEQQLLKSINDNMYKKLTIELINEALENKLEEFKHFEIHVKEKIGNGTYIGAQKEKLIGSSIANWLMQFTRDTLHTILDSIHKKEYLIYNFNQSIIIRINKEEFEYEQW